MTRIEDLPPQIGKDGFDWPLDVRGECNAHLYVAPDPDDAFNAIAFRCGLEEGHEGEHRCAGSRFSVQWYQDERAYCPEGACTANVASARAGGASLMPAGLCPVCVGTGCCQECSRDQPPTQHAVGHAKGLIKFRRSEIRSGPPSWVKDAQEWRAFREKEMWLCKELVGEQS